MLYAKVGKYLESHPCVDCGESDYLVLEFDHKIPANKINSISKMISNVQSWTIIKKEILKCRVLCVNCHKKRTAKQQGWYSNIDKDKPPKGDKTRKHDLEYVRRKKNRFAAKKRVFIKLFEYYGGKSCIQCGNLDHLTWEFNHRNPSKKTSNISSLLQSGYKWEKVLAEIKKCDILCGNCHRRETVKHFGWYK